MVGQGTLLITEIFAIVRYVLRFILKHVEPLLFLRT
jgi:hypothetical protein